MKGDTGDSPLRFPCAFPIKAVGRGGEDFELLVVELVRRHAPDLGEGAVRSRPSRAGNYLSVTVTVQARSREQLDAIYRELTACERVIMAL
ncbi:MAG: DUF493 domain-containing protein [Gammaproteobacteria bacterium]|nr:MAG: DUF493 domain-containing protein [Gammaproteobacteria bacterium]